MGKWDAIEQAFVRHVGRRVAQMREARGWTQARLAGALDIEASSLSRLENGHRPMSLPLLARTAQALEVSPADLVDHAPPPLPIPPSLVGTWAQLGAHQQELVTSLARELVHGSMVASEPGQAEVIEVVDELDAVLRHLRRMLLP